MEDPIYLKIKTVLDNCYNFICQSETNVRSAVMYPEMTQQQLRESFFYVSYQLIPELCRPVLMESEPFRGMYVVKQQGRIVAEDLLMEIEHLILNSSPENYSTLFEKAGKIYEVLSEQFGNNNHAINEYFIEVRSDFYADDLDRYNLITKEINSTQNIISDYIKPLLLGIGRILKKYNSVETVASETEKQMLKKRNYLKSKEKQAVIIGLYNKYANRYQGTKLLDRIQEGSTTVLDKGYSIRQIKRILTENELKI